ncbi:MAG: hypothetical protein WCA10_10165 [Terracidiphilus sp.]
MKGLDPGEAMNVQQELQRLAFYGIASADSFAMRQVARAALAGLADLKVTQHPLGFYHLLLYKQGALSMRLHYWPPRDRPPNVAVTPFHDHIWALQSCILVGEIENVLVSLSPNEIGPYNLALIEQIDGVDCVVPSSKRVEISKEESTIYKSGESYSMAPRLIHCTRIQEGLAAVTMVRSEVIEMGGPWTLIPAGYSGQSPARILLDNRRSSELKSEICELLR